MQDFTFKISLPEKYIEVFQNISEREKDRFKRRVSNMIKYYHETSKCQQSLDANKMRPISYIVKTIPTNTKMLIKRIADIEETTPTQIVRLAIADLIGLPQTHIDRKRQKGGQSRYAPSGEYVAPNSYNVVFKDGDRIRTNTKFKLGREDANKTNAIIRSHVAQWCVERLTEHGEQP